MNFIFDVGNVLVDFLPVRYLESLFTQPRLIQTLNKTIFQSPEWIMLDKGIITRQEACDVFCCQEPAYREEILRAMEHLPEMLTPIHSTIALLPLIKEKGNSLFYLSNYHKDLSRYLLANYAFFALFDGGVFSCDVHMLKPSQEIYQHTLRKYSLSPQECLFFDDMPENVAAAEAAGIHGVLFTGAGCVEPYI